MNENAKTIVVPDVGIVNKYENAKWHQENILTARNESPYGDRFQTMPVPMTNIEWQYVQDSLRAFGCIELADRLKQRRDEMELARDTLQVHAMACRDMCDERKVCSVGTTFAPIVLVRFSGHGSFGPDASLYAMKKVFNDTTRFGALRGCGFMSEGVIATTSIWCG